MLHHHAPCSTLIQVLTDSAKVWLNLSSQAGPLTWLPLAVFISVVDVDQCEVVSFWMIQLHMTQYCFCFHANRGLEEATRSWMDKMDNGMHWVIIFNMLFIHIVVYNKKKHSQLTFTIKVLQHPWLYSMQRLILNANKQLS